MKAINTTSFIQKMKNYSKHPFSLILYILVILAMVITVVILISLVGYILIKGIPQLKPSLFAWHYNSDNVSMMPAIVNTITMTVSSLIISAPLGIFSAIYLTEYASRGNRLVKVVRTTTETLAGIPSIVYGLFGYLMFVVLLKKYSMLAGAMTLSIMVLPTIMRTTEESIKAVPDTFREGSFGLGAGRLRTVFRIILPSAMQGILAGVILSVGRIVGETAALIFTAGTAAPGTPSTLLESGRTLATHMYMLSTEGLHIDETYATAVVLLILVVGINALSKVLVKKVSVR